MCGVLPIIIPLLIVKSRYTSLLFIYLFIWISKCETLLRTESKRNSASTIQRKCTEAVNWNQLRVHRSKNSSQFENQRATQNSHPIKKSAKNNFRSKGEHSIPFECVIVMLSPDKPHNIKVEHPKYALFDADQTNLSYTPPRPKCSEASPKLSPTCQTP